LKSKKQKEREREVRKKVLRRRMKIREEAREEAKKALEEREVQRDLNKFKAATVMLNRGEVMTDEQIKEKLNHNMQILKALQDEHDAAEKAREEMIKNNPPQFNLVNRPSNWSGSADVAFTVNEEEKKEEITTEQDITKSD
jgi:hypothetical protein